LIKANIYKFKEDALISESFHSFSWKLDLNEEIPIDIDG